MTMSQTPVKERKVSLSASCKIDSIIRQLFLPMLSMQLPESTCFTTSDEDECVESIIMQQVSRKNPTAMNSEGEFVAYMVQLYQRFQQPDQQELPKRRQRLKANSAAQD